MKLTLGNKILSVLIPLLLFWQYRYVTTSACPADTVSKAYCWGHRSIEIFGINFNQGYLFSSLKIFVFSLAVAIIVSFIIYKLKNKEELKSILLNWMVRIFGIVYIVFSIAIIYWNMSIVYKVNPELCSKDCQQITPPAVSVLTPDSTPSPIVSSKNKFTDFITGFKLDNIDNIKEISKIHFELAKELKLDYIIVPIKFPKGSDVNNIDWSGGLDYYYIFELSKQYGVKVLPAFYKLGGQDDKNYTKYADFVILFLDKFYKNDNINYIEFQNEPIKGYNGKTSARFGGTPTDLAKSHLAAYDKIKIKYPLIKVGTAGFMAVAVSPDDN